MLSKTTRLPARCECAGIDDGNCLYFEALKVRLEAIMEELQK
jgi:hypothetical protein